MKVDYNKLMTVFVALVLGICMFYALTGCSAHWHYTKAIKKGLKPLIETDTIKVSSWDTLYIDGDTILVPTQKDTVIRYQNVYIPKTRWQTRIEYKYKRDTLELVKYRTKYQYKQAKQDNPIRQFKGLLVWGVLILVLFIALSWLKK